jgi:hypothetical protein
MDSSDSQIYIGYSKRGNTVWTVEFNLTKPPENENIHFCVAKFKILQIEDADGKLLRKIPGYAINSEYYLRKHPIRVFLKRENADFHKFYETNKKKYDNYTGSVTEYYSDGNVYCSYYLVSGKLNGQFIAKKKNEKIIEKSFFVDNLRHGLTTVINNKYEIQCEYNMGGLININIIISDQEIYDMYENHIYANCNGEFVVNGIVNIIREYYEYDSVNNKNVPVHNAFIGNVEIENYNIKSWDITITDIHKRKLVDEYVKPIPQAICDSRYVSYTFYNYCYDADD